LLRHSTHATPAGAYAHVAHRDWENDAVMPTITRDAGCRDIAYQLINEQPGQSFNVIFGGGRRNFRPARPGANDAPSGLRTDGINLIDQWKSRRQSDGLSTDQYAYVETRDQLKSLDFSKVKKVLGLFSENHLEYEAVQSALNDKDRKEPTLTEMTEAAIKILRTNANGFVLLVEGGRIDHAHHQNLARKALQETVEFDRAIAHAHSVLDVKDTLIAVTADHSHGFTMNGYPTRGNSIFGMTGDNELGNDHPFTTLLYASGPGHREPRWQSGENTGNFIHDSVLIRSLDTNL
jgi:alkaline phosphatase